MASSAGFTLKQCKGFLPTPFSAHMPIFAGACFLTWACSYLNGLNFKPVESMTPEYKTKENIIARTDAPPVFINPIKSGLPGSILGPDDIPDRG